MAIRILPKTLVAKIAAGEVVERPASVVKELVENSLDAGATRIYILLEDAGTKKIIVGDNGHGMNREDAALAAEQHATSKITDDADLMSIGTFGFRGEALSSIAAVSRLTILTKPAGDKLGTQVVAENGVIGEPQSAGSPIGTTMIVETLFAHTPARKKYLKTLPTEMAHVMDVLTAAAIANPQVSFTVTNNKRRTDEFPADTSRAARLNAVLGHSIGDQLMPVSRTSPHLGIEGYIGKPQLSGPRKGLQFIFINGRAVSNQLVSDAVRAAYGNLLEPKAHPAFVLFLTLPIESVDVNIHPRKETVDFKNGRTVAEVITRTVQKVLKTNDLTYTIADDEERMMMVNDRTMDGYTANAMKALVKPWRVNEAKDNSQPDIQQIHNLYLLTETKNGLMLIDQHAAHERILYEQFKDAFKDAQAEKEVYELPEAVVFDLPANTNVLLEEYLPTLTQLGFVIESFGKNECKVRSVPVLFKGRDIASLVREMIESLADEVPTQSLDAMTERTLAFLSCRSAIKGGDYISPKERRNLLEKLAETNGSYTCPHGRPTHIELSKGELEKLFKR